LAQPPVVALPYDERVAIILGLITLVLVLTLFASCRSCMLWLQRLGLKNINQGRTYRVFTRYHAVYWWLFGVSLVSHLIMSIFHTGLPQAGDPDAGIHWVILSMGLTNFVLAITLFGSCRIALKLFAGGKPQGLLNNIRYKFYYRFHAYYWIILLLAVTTHFAVAYLHTGIWPG
jgi:hypothetical protein